MALITPPAELPLRNLKWRLQTPSQSNRSAWTGARKVVGLPGAARWTAQGEFVTQVGQAKARAWRAFFMALRGQQNSFALSASEGGQHPFTTARVGWMGALIADANGGVADDGRSASKVAGGAAWNAGVYSPGFMAAGDVATFYARQVNKQMMVGLAADPTASAGYNFPAAWYFKGDGSLEIYEAEASQGGFGSYDGSTLLGFRRTATGVEYLKNGSVVRTRTLAATQYHLDSSIYDVGAAFTVQRGAIPAGARQVAFTGVAASVVYMHAGDLVTLRLDSGVQLVCLTTDVPTDAYGRGLFQFEPELRRPLPEGDFAETILPFAHMSLREDVTGWEVETGQLYGFSLDCEEAW